MIELRALHASAGGTLPELLADPRWETRLRDGRSTASPGDRAEGGIYVLELHVERAIRFGAGALGRRRFPAGRYAYVGRAMRGLEARLARHRRRKKDRPRWHIDFLRARARLVTVSVLPTADPSLECEAAAALRAAGGRTEVPGFGASDCACPSHLVFYPLPGTGP